MAYPCMVSAPHAPNFISIGVVLAVGLNYPILKWYNLSGNKNNIGLQFISNSQRVVHFFLFYRELCTLDVIGRSHHGLTDQSYRVRSDDHNHLIKDTNI